MERIQKLIAKAGIASRRKAEELIKQGRVTINGKKAEIGQQAEEKDDIKVDGKTLKIEPKIYYKFYKPRGYVTTLGEEHGARTITELIPKKVFPVGRLDKDAEGLLLLTNDGEWANKLSHPRYNVLKDYEATLDKPFKGQLKDTIIEGRKVTINNAEIKENKVKLSIHEGRKHIVKKIFRKHGYTVKRLIRTRIGQIGLGKLRPGEISTISRTQD